MSKAIDIKGIRFGRLIAIEPTKKRSSSGCIIWKCKCNCGTITYVPVNTLRNGQKSCGCLQKEAVRKANTTHGKSYTKIHRTWSSIKDRCLNSNDVAYNNYGGRGIKICEEWANDFMTFCNWSYSNGYNETLTIDRIDNNGNYEPSNCRWVERKTQQNNRRNNHYITINNETKTLQEWGESTGIKPNTINCRIRKGWSCENAIFTPLLKTRRRLGKSFMMIKI